MPEWVKLTENDFEDTKPVSFHGTDILLIWYNKKLYAIYNQCSHEQARLSDGEYDEGEIYCPKHGACFDIKTGIAKTLPATESLKTFEVKTEPDGVYILWNS